MPDIDRYPFLSPRKVKVASPDSVMALVRATWPQACQEGSTGYERTWVTNTPIGRRLVAHSWSPRRDMAWFWVRVSADLEESAPEDVWNDSRVLDVKRTS